MKNFLVNIFEHFFSKKIVGVDIGTSSIKIVEVSQRGQIKILENYGELKLDFLSKELQLKVEKGDSFSTEFISKAIKSILEEAKIKTKSVIFSIPDFSSFSISFEIPPMPEKEIAGAIRYNASQYLTLPINDLTLDWQIISNPQLNSNSPLKVFIVAIPNNLVQTYQIIAKTAGLELNALEAEVFGLRRALVRDSKKTVCLIDMGTKSSTISIADDGFLKRSYSFNFNSNQLSETISSHLGIQYIQAEEIKNKEGFNSERGGVREKLCSLIDPLLAEVKSVFDEFFQLEQKEVQEIYLTGGTANLPGLKEYISQSIQKQVSVPDCFSLFAYPHILDQTLKEMSPSFSVAVGVALGGLES